MNPAQPPILLTEAEAAEALRLCTRKLREARQQGILRYLLIGRAVRYTMEDLESFVATLREVQPACQPGPQPKTRRRGGAEIIPFSARR